MKGLYFGILDDRWLTYVEGTASNAEVVIYDKDNDKAEVYRVPYKIQYTPVFGWDIVDHAAIQEIGINYVDNIRGTEHD